MLMLFVILARVPLITGKGNRWLQIPINHRKAVLHHPEQTEEVIWANSWLLLNVHRLKYSRKKFLPEFQFFDFLFCSSWLHCQPQTWPQKCQNHSFQLLLLANLIQLLKPIIFFFIKCANLNALFWNEMVWLLNTPKRRENQIQRFLFKRKYSSCGCWRNIIYNLRHNVQGRIHLSAAIPQCLLMKLRKSLVGRGSFITISNTIILTFVRSNFFSFH